MGTARGLRGATPTYALVCVFTLTVTAAGAFGCQALVGIPDVSLEEDGGAGGPSVDSGPCGPAPDRRSGGPGMVEIAVPRLATSYCIDTTEVTVSQFNAYLVATLGAYTDVPSECAPAAMPASPPGQDHKDADLDLPIGDVSACDAFLFCRWAGKRLCGVLGDGGPVHNGQTTEWSYACANGDTNYDYPYGPDYQDGVCNVGSDGAVPVGSMTGCHGATPPFDRIFDMVGNETEFVNDLEVNGGNVGALGGSYATTAADLPASGGCTYSVGFNGVIFDNQTSSFRCCADPDPP